MFMIEIRRFFLSIVSDEVRLLHRENAYLRERYRQKAKETQQLVRSMNRIREWLEIQFEVDWEKLLGEIE